MVSSKTEDPMNDLHFYQQVKRISMGELENFGGKECQLEEEYQFGARLTPWSTRLI